MQNILLDILILGLLVLLFGSIYRRHATVRIRFWLLGWFAVLLHFGLLLLNPTVDWQANLVYALAESALILCGASFALSSTLVWEKGWRSAIPGALLAAPAVTYVTVSALAPARLGVLTALATVAQAGFLTVTWYLGRRAGETEARPAVARRWSFAILAVCTCWMAFELAHRRIDESVYPLLTEVFLLDAVLFWEEFRRASAGVLAGVIGLGAWGAVFPVAVAMSVLWPKLQVAGELWNVPKYFVAFGMILTLLEEQKADSDARSQEYRVLFEDNPHPMWIFDIDTLRFLKVNDAAISRYGYSQEEFCSMSLRDIRPQEEVEALEQTVASSSNSESVLISGPWTHILRDGRRIQVEVSSHSIRFEGRLARFSLVQDVTERQQLHQQLLHQAHHDMLTGLPNRLLLLDRMEQALASAGRRHRKVAVICLDLDRFKQINDSRGHAGGDAALKALADVMRATVRETDIAARFAGDEFALIMPDTDRIAAGVLMDRFYQSLRMAGLACSTGIAFVPGDAGDERKLLEAADAGVYVAKRSGKNTYRFAAPPIRAR